MGARIYCLLSVLIALPGLHPLVYLLSCAWQVCTSRAEAVAELSCCLGSEWVPAEYGGSCSQPYDEYPAQKALLCHVAKLRQTSA